MSHGNLTIFKTKFKKKTSQVPVIYPIFWSCISRAICDDVIRNFDWISPYGCKTLVSPTQPLKEIGIMNILGSKRGRCVRLATLPPPCADCLEIWKPQTSRNLQTRPGRYRNCFTFL